MIPGGFILPKNGIKKNFAAYIYGGRAKKTKTDKRLYSRGFVNISQIMRYAEGYNGYADG